MSKVKLSQEDCAKLQSLVDQYGAKKVIKAVKEGFKPKKQATPVKCNNCNGLGYKVRSFADSMDNVIDCYLCQGKGSL